tara:strand:+ start:6271 stop:6984 length:714 start_codon:yes stop_codon:yes gene_type:complete
MENSRVLVISDMHCPYNHPDMIAYLKAIKKKYKPDRVIGIGDELDFHAMSFHDSDPDLPSASCELRAGQEVLKQVHKLFPVMDLVDSNHGSMAFRRAKAHGIPRHLILPYRQAIFGDGSGEGWNWHPRISMTLSNGEKAVFVHTAGANSLRNAEHLGANFVQGHHHSFFKIEYSSNPDKLYWGMTVGCLIDDDALAFAYNKITAKRPIIGCAIIMDGQPKLLPLVKCAGGRWNGVTP